MSDNRATELLRELRNLAEDVTPSEIIDCISITRMGWTFDAQWLDSWHAEFDRMADELEQAIAATLGTEYHGYEQAAIEAWESIKAWNNRTTHGTLTAEQVRKAIMSADRWEKPMGDTGLMNTHLIIRDDGWQAIADELNARAERTCECIAEYAESPIDGKTIVLHRCSACHELMRPHMCYCPNCGAKVVE